jgi:Spy/CpxP family protein refolding chaperone
MRKVGAILGMAMLVAACSDSPTAPIQDDVQESLGELATLAYSVTVGADGALPVPGILQRLGGLPAELALTAAQQARIRELVSAFIAATAADRQALEEIRKEAAAARAAGKSAAEVSAIFARGEEARKRLHEAQVALNRAVLGLLTPEQRGWLAKAEPPSPRACALTDAQRTEIAALRAGFEQANSADLALIRAIFERARAAHKAGASSTEVAAILAEAKPILERLRPARAALHAAVLAVLTPEQRAAGCMR